MADPKESVSSKPVAFMLVDQADGESAIKDKNMDVLEWSWTLQQPADARVEAGANGKAFANNLTFIKPVDKATPALLKNLLQCKHLAKAVLSTIKTVEGEMVDTYKVTMSNVVVAEMRPGAVDDTGRACEEISLNFESFVIEYNQILLGKPQGPVKYGWNLRTNKEFSE
jgi:type VI secretion system Hcp family effector